MRSRLRPAGQAAAVPAGPTPAGTYLLGGTITMPDGTVAPQGATATTDGQGNVVITSAAGVQLYSGPEPLQQSGTQPITATTPAPFSWWTFIGGAAVGVVVTGIAFHAAWKIPFGKMPPASS